MSLSKIIASELVWRVKEKKSKIESIENQIANLQTKLPEEKIALQECWSNLYSHFMKQSSALHFQFIKIHHGLEFDVSVQVFQKKDNIVQVVFNCWLSDEMSKKWLCGDFDVQKCQEFLRYFEKNDWMQGVNFVCFESEAGLIGKLLPLSLVVKDDMSSVKFLQKQEDGSWQEIVL